MYLTLVKDKMPELQSDKQASFAVAQSDDLYMNLLTEKFLAAASSFLNGGGVEALVETQLIIEGLTSVNKEKYEETYNTIVSTYGKYEKRIMSVQMHAETNEAEVEATIASADEPSFVS